MSRRSSPQVEARMPPFPESLDVVVVAHASLHVLGRSDAVRERKPAEEAPDRQELQPHEHQRVEADACVIERRSRSLAQLVVVSRVVRLDDHASPSRRDGICEGDVRKQFRTSIF